MKQFEVEIMGQPYVLGCPEGGEHRLHAAVAHVDDTMNRIRDAGKVRARDRIAVLAALNLALELVDSADRLAEAPPPAPAEPVRAEPEPDPAALRDAARLEALLQRLDDALAQDAPADGAPAGEPSPPVPQSQDEAVRAAPSDTASAMASREGDAAPADGGPAAAQEASASEADAPPRSEDTLAAIDASPAADERASAGDSIQNSERPATAPHG